MASLLCCLCCKSKDDSDPLDTASPQAPDPRILQLSANALERTEFSVRDSEEFTTRSLGSYHIEPQRTLKNHFSSLFEQLCSSMEQSSIEMEQIVTEMNELILTTLEECKKLKESGASASLPLGYLSHEFKTPLQTIQSGIDICRETGEPIEPLVRGGLQHLRELIEQLPDTRALEVDVLSLRCNTFTLMQLQNRLNELTDPVAKQCGKRIQFYLPKDPVLFGGDFTKVVQVALNLASNALKYAVAPIQIIFTYERTSVQGAILKIQVKDNGPGISKEQQQRLFTPFSNGRAAITRQSSGLGLYLMEEFVQVMNPNAQARKTMGVESTLGIGSSFWFTAEVTCTEPVRRKLSFQRKKLKVLYAEDNATNVRVFERIFKLSGCSTPTIVGNGQLALDQVHAKDFDIVVLDDEMPVLSGSVAAARLFQEMRKPVPPILIVTGNSPESIRNKITRMTPELHPHILSLEERVENIAELIQTQKPKIIITGRPIQRGVLVSIVNALCP